MTCDGEIFNYPEFTRKPADRNSFYSYSNVEVVLHLYEDLEENRLQHLNDPLAELLVLGKYANIRNQANEILD